MTAHPNKEPLVELDVSGGDLPADRTLEGWVFERCRLRYLDLAGLVTDACRFISCDLTGADLTGSHHTGSAFTNCRFEGARLSTATFLDCKLTGSEFIDTLPPQRQAEDKPSATQLPTNPDQPNSATWAVPSV